MEYRRFGNQWVVRIDRGEEIVAELKRFCERNEIKLATLSGIGASNRIQIGLFKTDTKEYLATELRGDHEITSLTGNVSRMAGNVYLHLHATVANANYRTFGGHLSAAVVSGTCEIVITEIPGEMDRQFDPDVGLNLYTF